MLILTMCVLLYIFAEAPRTNFRFVASIAKSVTIISILYVSLLIIFASVGYARAGSKIESRIWIATLVNITVVTSVEMQGYLEPNTLQFLRSAVAPLNNLLVVLFLVGLATHLWSKRKKAEVAQLNGSHGPI